MPSESDPTWYVYIVRCQDQTYYTGITTDLARRLAEHNGGLGAKYTRPRRPVVLVYSESAISRSTAAKREYQIKKLSLAGKKKLIKDRPAFISANDTPPETESVAGPSGE